MNNPDPKDDETERQEQSETSGNDKTGGRRVPPLDLGRAREFATCSESYGGTGKTASDSEMLIKSELPNLRQPEFNFKPSLFGAFGQDSPHLPETAPSALSDEAVQLILQGIDSWGFDIFQIDDENLPKMVEKIFRELGLFDNFPLDVRKLQAFTQSMVVRYQPNPYHNFRHACDVLHAVYLLLTLVEAKKKLTPLEIFALALAALCHDVDHPGLTNQFLVATYDILALRYNDRAVLESHHAATCFITMRGNDSLNLLAGLSEEEQRHMRKLMITLILATDMGEHARILEEAAQRLQDSRPFEPSPFYTPPGCLSPVATDEKSSSTGIAPAVTKQGHEQKWIPVKVYKNPLSPAPPIQSTKDVMLLMQLVIKCADISNVVKPFFLSKRWAALLLLEWFRQGAVEKQLGLPISRFMDREDPTTLMAMTCGCIDYIAKPMYELILKLLPRVQEELLVNLSFNRQLWNTFSTNGRRASERLGGETFHALQQQILAVDAYLEPVTAKTAQDILGPYAPPPLPEGEELQGAYMHAPIKLEGKLIATFSGQYLPTDSPNRKRTPPSHHSLQNVAEEPEEDVHDSPSLSATDQTSSLSSLSRLGNEEQSSVQTSLQTSSRAGTLSPSSPGVTHQLSPSSPGTPFKHFPDVEDRVSPRRSESAKDTSSPATSGMEHRLRGPESPGLQEPHFSASSQASNSEHTVLPSGLHAAHRQNLDGAESSRSGGMKLAIVPTGPHHAGVRVSFAPTSQEEVTETEVAPVPISPDVATDQVLPVSSSLKFPGVEEPPVSSSKPYSEMRLHVEEPIVKIGSRVQFSDSPMPTSEPSALTESGASGIPQKSTLKPSALSSSSESALVDTNTELPGKGPELPAATDFVPVSDSSPETDSKAPPKTEEETVQPYEAPLSLLFGVPTSDELLLPAKIGKDKGVSLVSALLPAANRLISDRNREALEQTAFRASGVRGSIGSSNSFGNGELELEKSSASGGKGPALGFWESLRTHPRVARLNRALESKTWNALLILATFVALFADDVVKGFLPKKADMYESHVLLACFILFLIESSILCVFRDRYFLSFFFWYVHNLHAVISTGLGTSSKAKAYLKLDLLGSVTLVPFIIGINSQNLVIARTGRAAKTVTRFSKSLQAANIHQQIANNIRILRVFRFFGFYDDSTLIKPEFEEEEKFSSKPSQLWTRLAELTSQKLILGVLVIIILTPYFTATEKDLAPLISLDPLDDYLLGSDKFNLSLARMLNTTLRHNYKVEYLGVKKGCRSIQEGGFATCQGIDTTGIEEYIQILPAIGNGRELAQQKFRTSEILSVTSDSTRAQAFYSMKNRSKLKYGMNIASTVIILVLLAVWCFFLSRDSNRLLIQPIERMVEFVKELAEDPLSFAGKSIVKPTGSKRQVMETYYVEAALVKIASLTKVALGDAGMDILSVNLKGSEFNPMLPGKKVRACFGFCDIRNFTDATECLQEDVMMFVNRIADVVHNKVVLHSGFPNKNIGDAFLIVWKKTVSDNTNKSRATSFADRALRAFLDIIQSIETSQSLAEFAKHPAIQERMPGYRIHMGFGLHVGWAIEGAIGSAHKVDPSYLSPHVNMASRLEAATKQYGVMLLISETVVAHLTKSSLRDSCRKLDRVTVKGSQDPMVLYTFDIPLFQQDLRGNPQEYRDIFEEAVDSYIDGDWDLALERLQECQSLWPTDKPANVLLNFMSGLNNQVPENWAGFRELTEK